MVIVLKENVLHKKRFRDICNDSEHHFLVLASLRKEVFRQLHEYVTAGHFGRRKTYDKIRKYFTGTICTRIYPIGVESALPVGLVKCPIDMVNTNATIQCWLSNGTHWT